VFNQTALYRDKEVVGVFVRFSCATSSGRLLDLHKQGFIDLDHLHALVLDRSNA
jgi:hypothetical protein